MFLLYFVCLYLIGIKTNNIKVMDTYEDGINFIALTEFSIAPNLLPYTKVIICL